MVEKLEVIKINDKIITTETLKLSISKMKELDWDNSSITNNFFMNYWDDLIPDDFIKKKDIVDKLKLLTTKRKYSKTSFKKFFLENK